MWLASTLNQKAQVDVFGQEVELSIGDMADGCIGCLLVFGTKEQAIDYVGDENLVVQVDYK